MNLKSRRKLADFLKRAPWLNVMMQRTWRRLFQPWITAGAVGAVFNPDGQVLLVEHVFHPKCPWGLPGGWMDRREHPADTVRREVFEETGLHVQVTKPLLVVNSPYISRHLDISYLCYAPPDAGEIRLSAELLAHRWLAPSEIDHTYRLLEFHWLTIQTALKERQQSPSA